MSALIGAPWEVVDPPNGLIPLMGLPLGQSACCPGHDLGSIDTIIERLQDTSGLDNGPATVPIQICELNLTSVVPFTVQNTNTNEFVQWILEITRNWNSGSENSGEIEIERDDETGGSFVLTGLFGDFDVDTVRLTTPSSLSFHPRRSRGEAPSH